MESSGGAETGHQGGRHDHYSSSMPMVDAAWLGVVFFGKFREKMWLVERNELFVSLAVWEIKARSIRPTH